MRRLTIGELARQAGVGVETVRYYQRRGLLPQPSRPARGYREYSVDVLAKLRLIRRTKALGLSLAEINQLLALRSRQRAGCGDLRALLSQRHVAMQLQVKDLQLKEKALADLLDLCPGGQTMASCAAMKRLEDDR
jgi:MerR family copper efflux transcriptional regulator